MPDQGTNIPQAMLHGQTERKEKKWKRPLRKVTGKWNSTHEGSEGRNLKVGWYDRCPVGKDRGRAFQAEENVCSFQFYPLSFIPTTAVLNSHADAYKIFQLLNVQSHSSCFPNASFTTEPDTEHLKIIK